jgi:hypothetical protein
VKLVGVIGTAILVSSLGIAVPVFADHGGHGDRGKEHGRRDDHREHAQPAKEHHAKPAKKIEHRDQHYSPSHATHPAVWREHRAAHWENEHRGWRQRGGYHGYRVPHQRYVVYFGPQHRFRVHTLPVVVVAGHPRFRYHDCWISVVDPWPEYWSDRWYETDDVYVEYAGDGYYLHNARHPKVAIAVNLSL